MTESIRTGVVGEFTEQYFWLSNFYPAPFTWRHIEYPTSEHAFQAAKGYHIIDGHLKDIAEYMDKVCAAPTPKNAKYLGKSVDINAKTWDAYKVGYMREIVHAKFAQVQGLSGKLINTGAMLLVEGNNWNDRFWGRCGGKGLNTLGSILMEERGYWLYSNFEETL